MLTGTEVKSLRDGNAQLKDSYAVIATERCGCRPVHRPISGRHAREPRPGAHAEAAAASREIERLIGRTHEKGLTLVPTRIYFAGPRSRAKVEIALASGKNLYDKRESIRKRDTAREVQRELRELNR